MNTLASVSSGRAELGDLVAENMSLKDEVTELRAEIAQLRARLAQAATEPAWVSSLAPAVAAPAEVAILPLPHTDAVGQDQVSQELARLQNEIASLRAQLRQRQDTTAGGEDMDRRETSPRPRIRRVQSTNGGGAFTHRTISNLQKQRSTTASATLNPLVVVDERYSKTVSGARRYSRSIRSSMNSEATGSFRDIEAQQSESGQPRATEVARLNEKPKRGDELNRFFETFVEREPIRDHTCEGDQIESVKLGFWLALKSYFLYLLGHITWEQFADQDFFTVWISTMFTPMGFLVSPIVTLGLYGASLLMAVVLLGISIKHIRFFKSATGFQWMYFAFWCYLSFALWLASFQLAHMSKRLCIIFAALGNLSAFYLLAAALWPDFTAFVITVSTISVFLFGLILIFGIASLRKNWIACVVISGCVAGSVIGRYFFPSAYSWLC